MHVDAAAPEVIVQGAAASSAQASAADPIRLAQSGPLTKLQGQLQAALQARRNGAGIDDARERSGLPARLFDAGNVLVEIGYEPTAGDAAVTATAVEALVRGLGGATGRTLGLAAVTAWVPLDKLDALAADSHVASVGFARRVHPAAATISEGVAASNSDHWQTAGPYVGTGVKIASIDTFDNTGTNAPNDVTIASLQASGDWPANAHLTKFDFKTYGSGAASCATHAFGCSGNLHGDATLELVYDYAPGATYLAYDTYTVADWYNAILDAANVGNGTTGTLGTILGAPKANIISAALTAENDSIGDGTAISGSIAEAAGFAKANGVVMVVPAGNSNEGHWGGSFVAATTTGANAYYLNWNASGTAHTYNLIAGVNNCVSAGTEIDFSLQWNDWSARTQQYQLELVRASAVDGNGDVTAGTVVASATNTPGGKPAAAISYVSKAGDSSPSCSDSHDALFAIRVLQKTQGASSYLRVIDESGNHAINGSGIDSLEFTTTPGSLAMPADSPNVVSVGAADQADPDNIEFYSSVGPVLGAGGSAPVVYSPASNDPNPKPDLMQFDDVSTVSYGSVGQESAFYGTSAASAQAAGMFALLMNRFGVPATSADVDSLKNIAHAIASAGSNDLGSAGVDYTYGWGKFKFQYETALAFEQQPSNTAAAQVITPHVSVGVLDDEGFLIRYGLLTNIGLAIGTNPSGGVLSQTSAGISSQPVNGTQGGGVATFNSASINKVGNGYTLVASAGGLVPSVTSNAFNITLGAPASITFSTPPSDVTAGVTMTPAVVVHVQDAGGNPVANDSVTLAVASGPSGATIIATNPKSTDASGNVTFSDIVLDVAGTYTLSATEANASKSAISASFTVHPAAASSLTFSTPPGTTSVNTNMSVVAHLQDSFGNAVSGSTVTLTIASGPNGAVLTGGGNATTNANGDAAYTISLNEVGTYTLSAVSGSLTATSSAFAITAGPATQLVFTTQPTSIARGGTESVVVAIEDAGGNVVVSDNTTTITLQVTEACGTVTLGTSIVTNGVAHFGPLRFYTVASNLVLHATSSNSLSGNSAAFNVGTSTDFIFADGFDGCHQ